MSKLINITHKKTEEVHRVSRDFFNSLMPLSDGSKFTHTTKNKYRQFQQIVAEIKANGGWADYKKEMLLQF